MTTANTYAISKEEASRWHYGNVSDWAKGELMEAVTNDLVLDGEIFGDCKKDITRQEFSTLAVNLYRAIKMEDPAPAPASTFKDTSDTSIRIAYNLGIIKGMGNGLFEPYNSITREQMGLIMLNVVEALGVDFKSGDGVLAMKDKSKVSSWAASGVDFVYENDFMKGDGILFNPKQTTPVEQAVAIVNRVYKKYNKPLVKEADDYRKGYSLKSESDGLYVQFNNTGNKKPIVEYGVKFSTQNGPDISVSMANYPEFTRGYDKIYFIDEYGMLISYDFKTDKYYSYLEHFGPINAFVTIETGKYKGYSLVREKVSNDMLAYDDKFEKVGLVYDLDPFIAANYIDDAYRLKAKEEAEEKLFKFVLDGVEYKNMKTYGGNIKQGETITLGPNFQSNGPLALVTTDSGFLKVYNETAMYKVSFKFKYENHSNAGMVFNVKEVKVGNDQYIGYYVGINPEKNSLMIGWTDYKWNKIKEVDLGFDVKKDVVYELMVLDGASEIAVYVDGKQYISLVNNIARGKGYTGIRGWNSNVEYISFTAEPMPY